MRTSEDAEHGATARGPKISPKIFVKCTLILRPIRTDGQQALNKVPPAAFYKDGLTERTRAAGEANCGIPAASKAAPQRSSGDVIIS